MRAEQAVQAEAAQVKAPWLRYYGEVPEHLDYPEGTMYEAVAACAKQYPNHIAYIFMGKKTTYRMMMEDI
ncbi:MAG: hypothetical protein IKN53_06195, partial [Oscillibacter sp.]|nr:hypothetical protein [Oscillibacter sp.]